MKVSLKLLIVFAALISVPLSYAQYDLNGNGTIDLPLTLVDGNQLRWFGQDLTTDEVFGLGVFGQPEHQVGIGHWISVDTANRVYVSKNSRGDFTLYPDDNSDSYQLGQSHDSAIVFLGHDIDSSGLLDAALLNGERSKWAWKLSFDPLSDHSSKRRILYGSKKDIPFLFRARGKSDSLGLLIVRGKRSKIRYRPLKGRRKREIRFRGFRLRKEQPLLIRGDNGRDFFGFVEDRTLRTFNSRGRKDSSETTIPKDGSILIGNFNSDQSDEIITFSEGKIIFKDGESKRLSDENVKPLSSKQSGEYKENDVSPTIAPTKIPTAIPSKTPLPTSSPTQTPIPTVTLTITPTPTLIPTYTLHPTFTAVPTVTPQPTFTSFPTFTASQTNTPTLTPTLTSTPTATPTRGAFISTWKTDNTGSVSANNQISLPLESSGTYNFMVSWGDGSSDTITAWNQPEVTHTYASSGVYTISISGTIIGFRFNDTGDKTKIIDIRQWGVLKLGNNGDYFYGCSHLNSTATDTLDLEGTTDLNDMFRGATVYNGDIGSWDTSNVTTMKRLFYETAIFNRDISEWDTSNVVVMQAMFQDTKSFNQDISAWDTSKVTDMKQMFLDSHAFNKDISLWDTSSVNDFTSMFRETNVFDQDIGSWNTSSATSMNRMFEDSIAFSQDLSGWCVTFSGSKPTDFDSGATSWINDPAWRPQWGTCPGTPTPTATPTP